MTGTRDFYTSHREMILSRSPGLEGLPREAQHLVANLVEMADAFGEGDALAGMLLGQVPRPERAYEILRHLYPELLTAPYRPAFGLAANLIPLAKLLAG